MKKQIIISIFLLFISQCLYSQHIVIGIDNDVLFKTDYYYTHSQYFSFFNKMDSTNFINRHLPLQFQNNTYLGFGIYQQLHTPKNITTDMIQFEDMPYSGELYFNMSIMTNLPKYNFELLSSINFGVMGPMASAYNTQSTIHSFSPNAPEPLGWKNQINNDILFNIDIAVYLHTLKYKYLSIAQETKINFGTYDISFAGGTNIKFGIFDKNSPIYTLNNRNNICAFIKMSAMLKFKYYDARFNGGMFSRSIYTIPKKELNLLVYNFSIQSFISYYKYGIELISYFLTPEFKNGNHHKYNSLKFYYYF